MSDRHFRQLEECVNLARELVTRFSIDLGSADFQYLIEGDPFIESALGASSLQCAIAKGTLKRDVIVTTEDGRKLQWVGHFLASGQYVGLENHDAPELRSPRELELEKQGYVLMGNLDVKLIKDGKLIAGAMTIDGLFFPIDGPLEFLNKHRPVSDDHPE
ncbi:hypothetical protein WT05_15540 [Burkholderia stagnalis]|nr:hypothetical protein WT05_15540 [Burkholderia stagnalis]